MDMIFTRSDQAGHLKVAAQLTGSTGFSADAETLAVYGQNTPDEDASLICIVVFEHFVGRSVNVHFAAADPRKPWASKKLMRGLFLYGFNVLKMDILRARIAEWNVPALVFALKCGWSFEGKMREGHVDGSDAILFSMKENECRFLDEKPSSSRATAEMEV